MKRGRILSLFLSIVLLASAIIPCLQLSVNADKANAISEIKAAWEQWKQADTNAPAVPSELATTEDLLKAISIAEAVINNSAYKDANNEELKAAVNGAWGVVKGDEELLIKAMQESWTNLVKNEAAVMSLVAYNKTGTVDEPSIAYDQSKVEGQRNYNYVEDANGNPLNDAAHSGRITTTVAITNEEVENFGFNYVKLGNEDPDKDGTASDYYNDDIPSFKVGDTIITERPNWNCEKIVSLYANIRSNKKVKVGYRVWYTTANGTYKADIGYVDVPADGKATTKIDIKKFLDEKQAEYIDGVVFFIKEIEGIVGDDDYLKIGSVLGSLKETLPSSVSGSNVSLVSIYNAASQLSLEKYIDGAAKDRFSELTRAAINLISKQYEEFFKDETQLLATIKNSIWPSLAKKETVTLKEFERYNSSGHEPEYSEQSTGDGFPDREVADAQFKFGINDGKSSGNTVLNPTNNEQREIYGSSYVKLTTQKFEDGTGELNADKSNDIPYLDTKQSVVITKYDGYSIKSLKNFNFTVNASMPMILGLRIWYNILDTSVEENNGIIYKATSNIPIKVSKGYTTVDMMSYINDIPTNEHQSVIEFCYVAVGIQSMDRDPTGSDYLEIGSLLGTLYDVLPENLAGDDADLMSVYESMDALDMDDYVDGEAKDNFIAAREAAKVLVDKEWEEIYKDQDRLAFAIKNQLWPKLVKKVDFSKEFRYYNSTGNLLEISQGSDWVGANAVVGTTPDVSGKVWGTESNIELQNIYGERYYRITTKKTNDAATVASDKDIPYLDTNIVALTLGTSENSLIDVANSHSIYFYLTASMQMSIRMRVWCIKNEDTNNNGYYDDWAADYITFNVNKGLNKIDLKKILVDNKIISKMKYIHVIGLNPTLFEHTPTAEDFLEIGSIGYEEYTSLPRKLENLNSLSAIVRVANDLNMDDYADNTNKTMFQTALAKANDLLNNLYVNLTEHAPIEVYETDASGNHTKLSEDEFGFEQQKILYDGDVENNFVEFNSQGKQIDVIFNLNDKMKLYDIRVYLKENNIKNLKIYTSPVREAIWDESGFVYEYDDSNKTALHIGRDFSEPIENQYVRFSFKEVEGNSFKVTEFKCIGKGIQQLAYTNLVEGKTGIMDYAELNYKTGESNYIRFDSNKWHTSIRLFNDPNVAFDGYLDTVADFVGGSRFESDQLTYNIVLNLNGLSSVDNIKYYAGSNPEYFPRKMKFYLGNDQIDILDNNNKGTVCIAEFDEATSDGVYSANFLARNATYVRIEIIQGGSILDDGCYGDKILTVAKDIQVNGLSLNASKTDAVKSFTDEETGIIVDILKLSEGDIYEGVQGMKITKRKPTATEIEQANGFDFVFKDWFYTVTLLNYRGDPVSDIEGREIRVSVPYADDEEMETTFMSTLDGDDVILMEHEIYEINEKFYMCVTFEDPTKIRFAIGTIDEYLNDEPEEEPEEEEPQDDYDDYDDYYDDDDYDDDDYDEDDDEDEETSSGKRKKYYKVIKKGGGGLSTGAIVGIVAGSAVAVSGGALLIIFRKKIFKPRIKKPKV